MTTTTNAAAMRNARDIMTLDAAGHALAPRHDAAHASSASTGQASTLRFAATTATHRFRPSARRCSLAPTRQPTSSAALIEPRQLADCSVAALSSHVRRRRWSNVFRGALDFACRVAVVSSGIVIGSMYFQGSAQRPEAVLSPVPHFIAPSDYGTSEDAKPAVDEQLPSPVAGQIEIASADEATDPKTPEHETPQHDPLVDEMPITFVYV